MEPEGGTQVIVTLGSQSSVAVTLYVTITPALKLQVHRSMRLVGHEITGGRVSSTTTTLKVQLVLLPAVSRASQFTGVLPIGNGLQGGGVQTTVTSPQLPVACGGV